MAGDSPVPNRLDPKLDVVFKRLLTREPALLRDMLEGVLERPILEPTVLNPDIPGELASDKEIILDIRVALADGSRVDVEMQIRTHPALPDRIVYYGARDYVEQIGRGDGYHLLTPSVVIVWLVEPLFAWLDRFHAIFELRERDTHALFGDQLAIHVLQLRSLSPSDGSGYAGVAERWARFLVAHDDAELDRLAAEDPIMTLAKQTLDDISQDPATRRLARERSDAIKLYKIDLAASRADGKADGEVRGRAESLLELLELRFDGPSAAIRARVEEATADELRAWAARVLTANSVEDVFAEP